MKRLIILIFLCANFGYGQNRVTNIFESDYNNLMEKLSNEDWEKSEKISKSLLEFSQKNDSLKYETMVLRYIYLYSTAGLMNDKKLSKKEAYENVKFLKSTEIIMPTHPFNSDCHVNCTSLASDMPNTFFTGVNNARGTQIFSFEYITIEKGIKESTNELEGKNITLRGELNEISVEGNLLPRFKLKFINGDYRIEKE